MPTLANMKPLHGAADMAKRCQPLRDQMVSTALEAGVDPLRLAKLLEEDLFHWRAWEDDDASGPKVLRRLISEVRP